MTHPNSVTNGASLEDCHTNFFALTDLCGIKWRRLCAENVFCVDPLDDPVFIAYTKCLAADILCVWRRVPSPNQSFGNSLDHNGISQQQRVPDSHHQLNCNKELWIFWYGEEPDLSKILCSELSDAEQGSWEMGLSYECRTLLFKALHNLIERYLISHNFARLGRWFVQPHSETAKDDKSPHLTFKFSFFVHGESTVCTSVDVRQHPAVFKLGHSHILRAQSVQNGVEVILSPYGLQGILTGQSFKESNGATNKLLEEWKQFYPILSPAEPNAAQDSGNHLPVMVEVLVSGVRMQYPSSYVFVTDSILDTDHPTNGCSGVIPGEVTSSINSNSKNVQANHLAQTVTPLTPPTSPNENASCYLNPSIVDWSFPESMRNKSDFTPKLTSRVCQDTTNELCQARLSATNPAVIESSSNPEETLGQWCIHDPAHKLTCACLHSKNKKGSNANDKKTATGGGATSNCLGTARKIDKSDKPHAKYNRGFNAFHRRSPVNDDSRSLERGMNSSNKKSRGSLTAAPPPVVVSCSGNQPVVSSSDGLPLLRSVTTTAGSNELTSASPHSVAPSPLQASLSVNSQVPSAQPASDPAMPTLSPHPPSTQEQENISPFRDNNLDESKSNAKTPSSVQNPFSVDAIKTEQFSPYPNNSSNDQKAEFVQQQIPSVPAPVENGGIKRPILAALNYEDFRDEDLSSGLLYDYTLLNAWVHHPVKRFKSTNTNEDRFRKGRFNDRPDVDRAATDASVILDSKMVVPSPSSSNTGEGGHDNAAPPDASNDPASVLTNANEKCGQNMDESTNPVKVKQETEVSDSESPTTPKPAASSSFTQEKDLIVTGINDLDQIFDTSGDDSDGPDNSFQTPPGSNKPVLNVSGDEGTTIIKSNRNSNSNTTNILGAAELVRMFPTPPSLEHNPAPSPCTMADGTIVDADWASNKDRMEISIGSPTSDAIKDWTYVYKIPERQTFVHSSKYSPLTNLPSSSLPPLTLPPDCSYKPWYQFNLPNVDKSISQLNMLPPDIDRTPHGSMRSVMAPSPMTGPPHSMDRLQPMSYELPSPASNASSYLNKNVGSVEGPLLSHLPEAHSLLVNVVLSDSLLNLFKDHNFDSCTMCVCNLNIRGADAALYLPGSLLPSRTDEAQYKCTCGFSAVRNRHLSYRAGLFYEDEFEITGIKDDGLDKRKVSLFAPTPNELKCQDSSAYTLVDLLLIQSVMLHTTSNSIHRTALLPKEYRGPMLATSSGSKMTLEMMDACEVCFLARDTGKQAVDNVNNSKTGECLKYSSMHRWPHISAKSPSNSQDVIRVMKTIQPFLQEAIQKKRTTKLWETTYTVSGPLTWRQFHRLAGRGTDDQCEPQPVPSLLVGYDKEWLAISPFALKFWEKLLLEPYAPPRDVAYIILAPDNEYILEKVRTYFKELSRVYELCRMGKHCPITKVLRDGIMRIGKLAAKKVSDEPVDQWFDSIGNSSIANKLKLYAQVCRHRLAPHLATEELNSNLLDGGLDKYEKCNASPMHPPPTPESVDSKDGSIPKSNADSESVNRSHNQTKDGVDSKPPPATGSIPEPDPQDDHRVPAVVIYMVDPFSYLASTEDYSEVNRLSMLGLLKCYAELFKNLPEKMQNNIHLQIVSLESILSTNMDEDRSQNLDKLKGLAFSVFTQCRRMLTHQSTVKSLTGFGPAASQDEFLGLNKNKISKVYSLFSPAYILAPTKDKQTELSELFGDRRERSGVLYCSYCLSEDQQWLLASCTDDRGEIMETSVINVAIPNRTRRKKASARRVGLAKLVDFLLGVMSMRTNPWRLVVGRLGRMGHGELKGWNGLLSKKSLMRASKHLKETCKQCSYLGPLESPVILSACLVNIEPDSALTIMSDQYTPDERFGSSCNSCPLSTPQDASCTHILVFPTSAITQSSQATFQQEHIDPLNADDILFSALDEDLQVDQDINAIFNWSDSPGSPGGSPHRGGGSQPGSPGGINNSSRQDPFQTHGQNQGSNSMLGDVQEETAQLAQQPLALGYYVSTAKPGPLPKWFWSSCSHLENSCPTFLKSALLIHSPSAQQNSEDLIHNNAHVHPLDSNLTTDVLRYVLEGYNSLSWLSLDSTTHDRRSCLPVHIQLLMQMYHSMQALV